MKPNTEKAREHDRENREQARRVLAGEVEAPWLEEWAKAVMERAEKEGKGE